MENKVVILCSDGIKKEYTLPTFGEFTIHTQDGKITFINKNTKERF